MVKGRGCPSDEAGMAGIALRRSHYMSSRLRLCVLRQIAAVMTRRALSESANTVIHCRGCERKEILVAAIALPRSRYVIRRFGLPATAGRVTGRAQVCGGDGRVTEGRWCPGQETRFMARVARCRSGNVSDRLHLRVLR